MTSLISKMKIRGVDHLPSAPTLEIKDVSVAYAAGANGASSRRSKDVNQLALENVSLQVQAGQHVAVVGPNGAGKSTLFKVIGGTIKPTRGKVNVYGHNPNRHICIGYVPQRSQIDASFPVTVQDVAMMGRVGQIGMFRWPRRRDWDIVHDSLERVHVGHLAKKQIGELSGGQQQRVFIAQALAQGADLLLLDEPFSGLDAPSHEAILDILDALRGEAVTVIVATHDLNLAAERFDRVVLLNRRVIAYGRAADVLTSPNLVQAYGGHMHVVLDEDGGLVFADSCCDDGEEASH